MKKKIIIIIAVCVLLVTLICVPKSTYQKLFSKNVDETPLNNNKEFIKMYVVNESNDIVGVNVYLESIEEDVIRQKWNILTSNINLLPSGYSSPIAPSTVLNNYVIEENKLIFDVSEEIKHSAGRLTIESIAWNFCNDEIDEVVLKVNNEILSNINDCNFFKISKSIGVNYEFETSYLYESDNITIVYYIDEIVYPVTYFYKGKDNCDYMLEKIFNMHNIEMSSYEYEISKEGLNIVFNENVILDNKVKDTIIETVRMNFDVEMVTVSNINDTIIKQTFVEMNDLE